MGTHKLAAAYPYNTNNYTSNLWKYFNDCNMFWHILMYSCEYKIRLSPWPSNCLTAFLDFFKPLKDPLTVYIFNAKFVLHTHLTWTDDQDAHWRKLLMVSLTVKRSSCHTSGDLYPTITDAGKVWFSNIFKCTG